MDYFENLPLKIIRKRRRKSLSACVNDRAEIEIKTSLSMPKKEIYHFLEENKKWILNQFEKIKKEIEKYPEKQIKEGESFLFLGKNYCLRFFKTLGEFRIEIKDDQMLFFIPTKYWAKDFLYKSHKELNKVLHAFYSKQAETILKKRVGVWSEVMQLFPKKVYFKKMKSCWGSCSEKSHISINTLLILSPIEVIDYVIIHELAHLKHLDHSDKFWKLVETYCPDYRKCKKYLKDNQRAFFCFEIL